MSDSPPGRRGTRSRAVFAGTALGAALSLALLVGEVLVRTLAPRPALVGADFYTSDPDLGYRLSPGHDGILTNLTEYETRIRINHLGLRGGPLGPEPRRPRILGVGDSFQFGFGVEEAETYLARAAAALGGEALNAGVPGYTTCQEVTLAERLVPLLEPDVLVLGVFLGNDEIEASPGVAGEVHDGVLVARGARITPGRRLLHGLYVRSHLVRLLRGSPLLAGLGPGGADRERRNLRAILSGYRDPPEPAILEADRVIDGCLERLAGLASRGRLQLLALLIPDPIEVEDGQLQAAVARTGGTLERLDLSGPRKRFRRLLDAHGIPVLDPLLELRSASSPARPVYFPRDRHLNAAGHAVVGEALARALRPAATVRR